MEPDLPLQVHRRNGKLHLAGLRHRKAVSFFHRWYCSKLSIPSSLLAAFHRSANTSHVKFLLMFYFFHKSTWELRTLLTFFLHQSPSLTLPTFRTFFLSPSFSLLRHVTVLNYAKKKRDVQSLAQYLHHLDKNEEAYWEYLQWKKDGPSQSFLELQNTSPRTALCRLCKEVARRQNRIAPTTHAHRTSPREP
ncbi:Fucosyltransferase [Balamuthia mandrillaris]